MSGRTLGQRPLEADVPRLNSWATKLATNADGNVMLLPFAPYGEAIAGRALGAALVLRAILDVDASGTPILDDAGNQQVRYGLFARSASGAEEIALLSGTQAQPTQPALLLLAPAPATLSAPGTPGEIRFDGDYIYTCYAPNAWKKTGVGSGSGSSHDPVTLDTNADTVLSLSAQALGLDTQAANQVWAGPVSGAAAAVPAFRALVGADLPAHNILGAAHGDAAVASAERGALITGQGATPAWTRLSLGPAGKTLVSDGVDVSWGDGAGLSSGDAHVSCYDGSNVEINTALDGFAYVNSNIILTQASLPLDHGTQVDGLNDDDHPLYVPADGSRALVGDLDFASHKAIALACDSGASFPATPATGQWFYNTNFKALFMYDGAWTPLINLATTSIYVDKTNGTDSPDNGFGTGTDAFATIAYALTFVPPTTAFDVEINLSADTYTEVFTVPQHVGAGILSFNGSTTTDETGTFSSQSRNLATSGGATTLNTVSGGSTTVTITGTAPTLYPGSILIANGITRIITAMASATSFTVDKTVDWYNGGAGYTFTYTHNVWLKSSSGWTTDQYNGKQIVTSSGNRFVRDMDTDWMQGSTLGSATLSSLDYEVRTLATSIKPTTFCTVNGDITFNDIICDISGCATNFMLSLNWANVGFTSCILTGNASKFITSGQGNQSYTRCYAYTISNLYRTNSSGTANITVLESYYNGASAAINVAQSGGISIVVQRSWFQTSSTAHITCGAQSAITVNINQPTVFYSTSATLDSSVTSGTAVFAVSAQSGSHYINNTATLTTLFTNLDATYVNATGDTLSGNYALDTVTGVKIGTASTQKLGFWNATPVVQPTTAGAAATLTGGGGAALTATDTFDGYTLQQVVKALRNIGLLA